MRTLILACFFSAFECSAATQKGLALKDLPQLVQQTIQEQLKGGQITAISKEKENGITLFDVEAVLDGKHRELDVDTNGKILSQEEETSIESIPAAVKDSILKKVGTGKLGTVMMVTERGQTLYEAAYTTTKGKKAELTVKPDGTLTK